jgi:hypothetical protein
MNQAGNYYEYSGAVQQLLINVKMACESMSLKIKMEETFPNGFDIVVSQKMNWLSTNWPVKLKINANKNGDTYTLSVCVISLMGSITQSAHNNSIIKELLSNIKNNCL